MTQSDNIKEFLKYASPRLDYIEHCMEKQALRTIARQVKKMPKFEQKRVARAIGNNNIVARELDNVSDITKHMNMPSANRKYGREVMRDLIPNYDEAFQSIKKNYPQFSDKQIDRFIRNGRLASMKANLNPDYMYPSAARVSHMNSHFWRPEATKQLFDFSPQPPPSAKSYPLALTQQNKNNLLPAPASNRPKPTTGRTAEYADVEMYPPNSPEAKAFRKNKKAPEPVNAEVIDVGPGSASTVNIDVDAANALSNKAKHELAPKVSDAVDKTAKDAPSWMSNVKDWMSAHPYLTVGGGIGAGLVGGAGLGYGLGHGAGQQDGAQIAQRYYQMMMALDRARMRNVNDSFLSRLANLFGTGELSNMIG